MQMKIDLKQLFTEVDVNIDEMAELLFPKNNYPRAALNRIFTGDSLLNSDQIYRIAKFFDIEVSVLYQPDDWSYIQQRRLQVIYLPKFKVFYDSELSYTTMYSKTDMTVIEFPSDSTLSMANYLKLVKNKISQHE